MGTFVRADLGHNIVRKGLVVGKADLAASDCGAACRRIRSTGAAFDPDTEACDRLASGGVSVELSLQILQVEREVKMSCSSILFSGIEILHYQVGRSRAVIART